MKRIPYADLHNLDEDGRIEVIGKMAMEKRQIVAFFTDADPGKADRYIAKLKAKFPGIRIVDFFAGPVANVVTIKVGPPDAEAN